jgi:uncharacterized protein (DUF1800 family)
MPLALHTGVLGKKAAAHLLRRATFGPTKSEIDHFSGLTATQAITELFQGLPEPAAPVVPGASTSWVTTPPAMDEEDDDQQGYVISWWLGLMLNTNVSSAQRMAFSTREKITFLLHTHFTTIQQVVDNSRSIYFQNNLLRKHAFDLAAGPLYNIRDLAKKICVDNAMLALLDGRLNVKGNPNENFARELFELYTIGKGLSGQVPVTGVPGDYYYFTEQDIKAAALVLSGWDVDNTFSNIDPDTSIPRGKVKTGAGGNANQHDNTIKQFSNRMGNSVVTPNPTLLTAGQPNQASMVDEIDQLINMIFAQSETPKNICRKIYRFYVYHDITATIDSTIISQMVTTLVANNYKIEPVIRELLSSSHFYDALAGVNDDNFGAIIKSPLDLACGTLNFFEYQLPNYLTQTDLFYQKTMKIVDKLSDQGMNFMNPYDVAGYEAYHQFPMFNRHWINTNSLTQRYKFIYDTMTTENMDADAVTIDLLAFYSLRFSTNALDPDLLVREVASYLFPLYTEGSELTTERYTWFKSQFLKLGDVLNQAQPAFWQFSWSHRGDITASEMDARGMLQDKMNAMLQSPEYQLF